MINPNSRPFTEQSDRHRIESSLIIVEPANNVFNRPANINEYSKLFKIGGGVYYLKTSMTLSEMVPRLLLLVGLLVFIKYIGKIIRKRKGK
jgi:hypothetical protein